MPPSLCTNIDALFDVQELQDKVKGGSLSCQVKSHFGQVLSFWSTSDPVTVVPVIYCRVNLWIRREDAPPGVIINELASISASLNRVQTNVVKEYLLQTTHREILQTSKKSILMYYYIRVDFSCVFPIS
jgi:hypothetical protein